MADIRIENLVYRLNYVDYDAFSVGKSEISIHYKEHLSFTSGSNNPIEMENLQIKSAIMVRATINNHHFDIKNIKIIHK